MLEPNQSWRWSLDNAGNLVLHMEHDMMFVTPYLKKHVAECLASEQAFSIEDAAVYNVLMPILTSIGIWSKAQATQIALNATAVHQYFRPLMPKSWFFTPQTTHAIVNQWQLVTLKTAFDEAMCLVVEGCQDISVCMLLDSSLQLSENKQMQQFDVIKVMNDRLQVAPIMSHLADIDAQQYPTHKNVIN